jgi:hypothetical protein
MDGIVARQEALLHEGKEYIVFVLAAVEEGADVTATVDSHAAQRDCPNGV